MSTPRRRATVSIESPFLLEPEAAAYLRVSPRTLRSWRADGMQTGPEFRYHGGVIVYSVDSLEEWSQRTATRTTTRATGDPINTTAEDQAPQGAIPSH